MNIRSKRIFNGLKRPVYHGPDRFHTDLHQFRYLDVIKPAIKLQVQGFLLAGGEVVGYHLQEFGLQVIRFMCNQGVFNRIANSEIRLNRFLNRYKLPYFSFFVRQLVSYALKQIKTDILNRFLFVPVF